jgi:hypothetical protein
MEFTGDEQRIQALFCELKTYDAQSAPGFVAVWQRAESRLLEPRLPLRLVYAGAFGVLVLMIATLLWTRNSTHPQLLVESPANLPRVNSGPTFDVTIRENPAPKLPRVPHRRRFLAVRHDAQLQKHKVMADNLVAISTWQSPTTTLMFSPAEGVLSSLPQLTQAAVELKSFLPSAAVEENQ